MVSLVESLPGTRIRIFSGLEPGGVKRALLLAARGQNEVEKTPGISVDVGDSNAEPGFGTVILAEAYTAEEITVDGAFESFI